MDQYNDVAIIGAGMAGLTAARRLAAGGRRVTVFDKGRKAGGRLATRRGADFTFNHGCQYFTARDPGFAALMERAGAVPWPAAGSRRFAGVPDMAALAEFLAREVDVHVETPVLAISGAAGGWELALAEDVKKRFRTLILAIPAPQAAALLGATDHRFVGMLRAVHLAPCWAVMLGFAGDVPGPDTMRPNAGPIAWIARENSRPGRAETPAAYTIHAAPGWSQAHLEDDKAAVIAALTAAFAAATGITALPARAAAHRWRYALADRPLGGPCLWDPAARLGLCGDWCLDGKLEAAYLSGLTMGETILD
jgi:predicted NAD/FAD-dependent oxidoreductase